MYKSAVYNISGNILVNPTHYIEKEVYSKREVLEILQRYGHSIMPLKYCKGGMEKPKPLLLTGRDTIADHVSGHEPVPALPVHPVNSEKVHCCLYSPITRRMYTLYTLNPYRRGIHSPTTRRLKTQTPTQN